MEDIYIGTPNAKQDEFLRCKKKYVAFGGARGGGKSWAVRCKAKLLAQRYPGIRMLLVRRTMPEIEANHLETLRLELAGTAVYRAEERRFVFAERERIAVRILRLRPGRGSLSGRGVRRDLFRRGHAAEGAVDAEAGGVRARRERISQAAFTTRCNPGGPGHGYIKRLFIDRRYRAGENGGEYAFIPARVTDNGALLRAAAGVYTAAGGAAAEAAGGVAGGAVGRAGGAGVPGVHGRPGALSRTGGGRT